MTTMKMLLLVMTCALLPRVARAQNLNFTTRPVVEPALLEDRPDTVHLPAGSAVYAVVNVASRGFDSVSAYAATREGGGAIRVTVEMSSAGGWKPVSSQLVQVTPEQGATKIAVLPIIPDEPNETQSFNQLLDLIAAHKGPAPILVRVKVEGGEPQYFTQNGFYLDVDHGLGRYAEWLGRRGAAKSAASAAFDEEHFRPRSTFVEGYRSRRSDPKFLADVHRWWKASGSAPLRSTKICSDDYIVMRNALGLVSEKQLCALVTYEADHKCFAMMRRFSYRRVGRDTFENEVVDATYASQRLPADAGETFAGAHPYEIACSAAR